VTSSCTGPVKQPRRPAGRRRELGEHRRADGVLGADRHAEQQPHDEQLPGLGDQALQDVGHDERDDVDEEQQPAPEPVGEVADDRRAEEDADQRRGADQPGPDRRLLLPSIELLPPTR
jgi:hypothetical protein